MFADTLKWCVDDNYSLLENESENSSIQPVLSPAILSFIIQHADQFNIMLKTLLKQTNKCDLKGYVS